MSFNNSNGQNFLAWDDFCSWCENVRQRKLLLLRLNWIKATSRHQFILNWKQPNQFRRMPNCHLNTWRLHLGRPGQKYKKIDSKQFEFSLLILTSLPVSLSSHQLLILHVFHLISIESAKKCWPLGRNILAKSIAAKKSVRTQFLQKADSVSLSFIQNPRWILVHSLSVVLCLLDFQHFPSEHLVPATPHPLVLTKLWPSFKISLIDLTQRNILSWKFIEMVKIQCHHEKENSRSTTFKSFSIFVIN